MVDRSQLLNVQFEIAGQKQLDRALGVWVGRITDLRGVWDDIRDDFIAGEREQFKTEGGSGSGGWPPLSPVYKAWKDRHYPRRPLLVLNGRLLMSLTNKNNADMVYEKGKLSLKLGTKIPYAIYHQTGTSKMPARPPIELTERQKTLWPKLIQEYLFKTGQALQTPDDRITI